MFYAHTPVDGGPWHDLISHLEQTAERARENGEKFGAGGLARLAGLWHDLGKFNPEFQRYLKDCHEADLAGEKAPKGGSVPHAVYGAILAGESVQALAAIIHGHHAGLPNRAKYLDALKQSDTLAEYGGILPVAREAVEGLRVAPGLRVGRGLELGVSEKWGVCDRVAPGLRVGRGLELLC